MCKHPYESGELYALPYVGNSQLFFYRKDLFEKAGLQMPDKPTWDFVKTAAAKITDKAGEDGDFDAKERDAEQDDADRDRPAHAAYCR